MLVHTLGMSSQSRTPLGSPTSSGAEEGVKGHAEAWGQTPNHLCLRAVPRYCQSATPVLLLQSCVPQLWPALGAHASQGQA